MAALTYGARKGPLNALKKWFLQAGLPPLRVFAVPGADVLRAQGLNLAAAGLEVAPNPREADVLLVAGPLPPKLAENAAVVFAQMPRPRLLVVAGEPTTAPLPAPDLCLALNQEDLRTLLPNARHLLIAGWQPEAEPFQPDFIEKMLAQQQASGHDHQHMHHAGGQQGHGDMDHSQMSHGPAMNHGSTKPGEMDHGTMSHHEMDHSQMGHTADSAHQPPTTDHGAMDHGTMNHGQMGHGAMDHSKMVHDNVEHGQMSGDMNHEVEPSPAAGPPHPASAAPQVAEHPEHHAHHVPPTPAADQPPAPGPAPAGPDPHAGHHGQHTMPAAPAEHDHAAMMAGHEMKMADMDSDQQAEPDEQQPDPDTDMSSGMTMDGGMNMGGDGMEGEMNMEGMDMGFMSMVEMTKDLPRSADGLPMEASEAAFGPFFPGLPGGLNLRLHLDGDTVTKAVITPGHPDQSRMDRLPLPAREFASWLAGLDPLTPAAYHLLADRALGQAARQPVTAALLQLIPLEQERIASHLNWLIDFGVTIGHAWLRQAAEHLYWQLRQEPNQPAAVTAFVQKVRRLPLLRRTLAAVGQIPALLLHHARGPVARAAGVAHDARQLDPLYQRLGFAPVVLAENNAWGRLQVRLAEILQSQDLLHQIAQLSPELPTPTFSATDLAGTGQAAVETPRGTATLAVELREGQVTAYTLHAPSTLHVALVNEFVREQELGDALKTIASLDISPWTANA